jgi:hypothetical protein
MTAREREARALELRKQGWTHREIGDGLGISESGARDICNRVLARLETASTETAEEVRRLELERLDGLEKKAAEVLMKQHVFVNSGRIVYDGEARLIDDGPTLSAIDRLLKIQERRSKLLGLDAPEKHDLRLSDLPSVEDMARYLLPEEIATARRERWDSGRLRAVIDSRRDSGTGAGPAACGDACQAGEAPAS